MIRFAWLQARTQTVLAFAALAIVGVVVAVTGPHLVHLYNTNVVPCAAHGSCDPARAAFLDHDRNLRSWLGILVIVLPGIIGLFWGAPLVARELENGTHRLAWTQSVTRSRWLAAKLAVVGLIGIAVAGIFSLLVSWWASPFDTVNASRFAPPTFDERGIVVMGYTAFAFALGVAAGLVIRRTLPAMATTLVTFVVVRLVVVQRIRPNLMAPLHRVFALGSTPIGFGSTGSGPPTLMPDAPRIANAWIASTRIVDAAGHRLTASVVTSTCPRLGTDLGPPAPLSGHATRTQAPDAAKDALRQCVTKIATKYHVVTTYQPANRYWAFQWYELAIFLAGALALSGFCFVWIRRRLA